MPTTITAAASASSAASAAAARHCAAAPPRLCLLNVPHTRPGVNKGPAECLGSLLKQHQSSKCQRTRMPHPELKERSGGVVRVCVRACVRVCVVGVGWMTLAWAGKPHLDHGPAVTCCHCAALPRPCPTCVPGGRPGRRQAGGASQASGALAYVSSATRVMPAVAAFCACSAWRQRPVNAPESARKKQQPLH